MADHQRGIQTVELAGQILKLVGTSNKPLSLSEISEQLNMAPSSVYKYLVSLSRTGLLKRNESTLAFEAGALCLRLGLSHIHHDLKLIEARKALTQFAEDFQVNVFLSKWSDLCGPTVIFYKEFAGFFNLGFRLGISLSLMRTATGRLFVAYQDQNALNSFVQQQDDSTEPVDLISLNLESHQIKQQGYSILRDKPTPNISSIAVPVFDQNNQLIWGLTVFSQSQQLDSETSEKILTELKRISQYLSLKS